MEATVQTLVIVLYLVTLGVLALYGVHRSALLFAYLRHRHERTSPRSRFDEAELPVVTIQLPMFNEMFVAERLIEAAARVDYPRDRLEIQVLDDSTDATSTIASLKCDALRDEGIDVVYLHRQDRAGYKAGALEAGMARAKGEFLLIFDADFVPGKEILNDSMHHFTDDGIGMDSDTCDRIFSLFYSTKGRKGTGLGLFIANRIVGQHGGTITVASKPGEGAVFRVSIPRTPPQV